MTQRCVSLSSMDSCEAPETFAVATISG